MSQKILLVNPIAKKKPRAKKPRTTKQKAATKKLVAFNKARRKKAVAPTVKRSKPSRKKRSTPMAARKRRTAAQRAATKKLVALNRRRASAGSRRRRKNPIAARANGSTTAKRRAYRATSTMQSPKRRVTRRRRRNPIGGTGIVARTINNVVIPAVSATGGAIALDLMLGYLPLPVNWKIGPVKWLTKALGAVVLTEVAGMVVSKKTAQNMGMGALTVVMHEAAKAQIQKAMPTIKMDGIGYYSPAIPSAGYSDGSMGLYTKSRGRGMGMYTNSRPPSMGLYTNYGGEGEMNAEQYEPQH